MADTNREPTYKNEMVADAPRIMLIVLSRLLTTAKKVKIRCAMVPCGPVSIEWGFEEKKKVTISNSDDFQNRVCLGNATLANNAQVPKEDDDGRAAGAVPECTADSVTIGH